MKIKGVSELAHVFLSLPLELGVELVGGFRRVQVGCLRWRRIAGARRSRTSASEFPFVWCLLRCQYGLFAALSEHLDLPEQLPLLLFNLSPLYLTQRVQFEDLGLCRSRVARAQMINLSVLRLQLPASHFLEAFITKTFEKVDLLEHV